MASKSMENYISEFKQFIIQKTNEEVIEESNIPPVFNILVKMEGVEKPGLALVPIPNDLMQSNETKDILAASIMPQILKKIEEEGATPICISMVTEGWMWSAKDEEAKSMSIEEIKKTREKVEVVMISFETIDGSEVHIFDKMGTKKNDKGEYIEGVYLKPREDTKPTKIAGRFTNLFKRLEHA